MSKRFYSNGKLLLTGEYAVLDGALSLAVPTSYGQSLSLTEIPSPKLSWKSLDHLGKIWFQGEMGFEMLQSTAQIVFNNPVQQTLLQILSAAKDLNPAFLGGIGYEVETQMDFPRDWGLGSSSTLINNIAQWAQVDAFELLWKVFQGSGYDIACAQYNTPILYRLRNKRPWTRQVGLDFPYKDQLHFVHLNKKQDSREGIAQYRKRNFDRERRISEISKITERVLQSKGLSDFEECIREHEQIMSQLLGVSPIQDKQFLDFPGALKSLGAWGGDFILATGDQAPDYFISKGYTTVIPYADMVKG
ncbi:MAG: GYDIA family GHMP kinase [Bacteroidota bacterium]